MTRRHLAATTVPPVTTKPTSTAAQPAPTAFGSGPCDTDDAATATRRRDDGTLGRGDAA
jgi:hypothetical protein